MTDTGDTPRSPERLHALDAVRGFALLLGVVFHASLSFVPSPHPIWAIQDSHPSQTLGVVFLQPRLQDDDLFLIAGFFAHMTFIGAARRPSSAIG